MNITSSLRSVQEFHMTLSEADARLALTSPYEFAEQVGEQLVAAGISPNGGGAEVVAKKRRKPKPESRIVIGRAARKAKSQRPNATQAKKSGGLNRVKCPECSQEIASKYLPLHLRQKHGITSTAAANGARPEAAPAAA